MARLSLNRFIRGTSFWRICWKARAEVVTEWYTGVFEFDALDTCNNSLLAGEVARREGGVSEFMMIIKLIDMVFSPWPPTS